MLGGELLARMGGCVSGSSLKPQDFSTEALCRRILERNRRTVQVRKEHVALAKLTLIVDATLDLSNKLGFEGTSLRDLSKAANVSMGSLYTYFDTKETLVAMILGEVSATATEVLSAPPEGVAEDPMAHLRWLIETHLRLTEIMHKWFVFAFMEAKYFPAVARKLATDSEVATEKLFADVLEAGNGKGVFDVDDPTFTAALIKPLLQDWYVKRAKYRKRGTQIESYIAGVTAFILKAIEPGRRRES